MASSAADVLLESGDEAEESCAEKLFMFLYSAKAHHRAPELSAIFNAEFPLANILNNCRNILDERQQEYEAKVHGNLVMFDGERYVHPSDIATEKVMKRRLNRCLEKMPTFVTRVEEKCPIHSKKCRLLLFLYGFLSFLHLLSDETDAQTVELPSSAIPFEEAGVDEEIPIDPEEERALVPMPLTLVPVEAQALSSDAMEDNEQGDLPICAFPSFCMINQANFVLLTDIMHHFDIREDYCLAAIANWCEADMDWVEEGVDRHLLVDSAIQDHEYKTGKEILKEIFDEARIYEGELASEEEVAVIEERLGIAEMGRFTAPQVAEDSKSTIQLWTRNQLEADENQKVIVYDDEFLRRAGGTRSSAPSASTSSAPSTSNTKHHRKDAGLAEYVKHFDQKKIIIFHKEFSNENAKFPLFALKVLSRFCGGYEISSNAEKVVLVEKQFALRVFGQGPGCQAVRCQYYLGYSAAAILAGIKDPRYLTTYGKRELLQSMKGQRVVPGQLLIQEPTQPLMIEELTEENEDDGDGRPTKKPKPTTSSSPPSGNPDS